MITPPPGYRLLKDGENVPIYYAYFYAHRWHKRRRYARAFKFIAKDYFPFASKLRKGEKLLTRQRPQSKFGA